MKTAEELAKQIDAMTMTHDLHWQNIKPLIESHDVEIHAMYAPVVEALRNCRALAIRKRHSEDDWAHIARFCVEGGVVDSMLRSDAAIKEVKG